MRIVVVGLLMFGLVINASACSDEAPPVTEGGGSSSSGSSGNGSSSGNVVDAGGLVDGPTGRPDPARLCDPLAQRGQDVEATVYSGAPPPAIGGTITPGTYELILLERYTRAPGGPQPEELDAGEPPPPTSGQGGRATMYVLGNAIRFVEAWGALSSLPPDSTRGVSYVPKGTALETIEECPSAGKTKSIQYTVQGNSIALFTDTDRQVYQRTLEQGAE